MTTKTKTKRRPGRRALPKTFQGAAVVRAKGMNGDRFEKLVEETALDQFSAGRDIYVVVPDKQLEHDHGPWGDVQAFVDRETAVKVAQARGNGNVDHRVLRVTEQILVIATDNDL